LAIAMTGSGGSGTVTAGLILLGAVAHAGLYGLLSRSAGPQIRGGESAVMLRFGVHPVHCMGDHFDLLAALDWGNHGRFSGEIPLRRDSLILADPDAGELPESVTASGALLQPVELRASAAERPGGRVNMVAVGMVGAVAGLPLAALLAGAERTLREKGQVVVEAAERCIRAGFAAAPPQRIGRGEQQPSATASARPHRWNISGNEAGGLGALRAGVRFVAAYPITPASEMLEWLAPRLERLGGSLLQAEDELASINMIIGSSFGGVPSLTATSGPGLSLMMEGIGLAVASETPVVVADVMRGGPSTGIPTKSEQSDLDLALYGLHGDAPHLVLSALGIGDCAFTFDWAVRLAERLQTAAIVLSDQSLGQSRAIIDPPPALPAEVASQGGRVIATGTTADQDQTANSAAAAPYQRYALTDSGVSPMSLPGQPGCIYSADGLEHNSRGAPSSLAADHHAQLDKRRRKLAEFDYGDAWAEVDGTGDLCLIAWGSSRGAAAEAAGRLRQDGQATRMIALRLLQPLRRDALKAAIGSAAVLVVEQNQGAQLFRYLHAQQALPADARSLAHPGPLPVRPAEIVSAAATVRTEH
jgi:2-oxoglutarate ferredoxin oxidoreductase subunit alpha